ncbi:MAG: DNA-binding response regulator [Candidatus Electrothrix sp. AUS4]|nr:DNA-binding response regulator [Candidatus Electrothrix sp. AUS4]
MKAYRIIIADDHSLIRKGIKSLIAQEPGLEVIAEAADGQELMEVLRKIYPDMVILDISMPRLSGMEALGKIHRLYPDIRVLMLTMQSNVQYCCHAIVAGAHGYLLKDDSDTELLPAIRRIRQGKDYMSPQLALEIPEGIRSTAEIQLTPREKQVLKLLVDGLTTKQIAEKLFISPRTVDQHRSNLLKKFGKKKTVDLVNDVVKNPHLYI